METVIGDGDSAYLNLICYNFSLTEELANFIDAPGIKVHQSKSIDPYLAFSFDMDEMLQGIDISQIIVILPMNLKQIQTITFHSAHPLANRIFDLFPCVRRNRRFEYAPLSGTDG